MIDVTILLFTAYLMVAGLATIMRGSKGFAAVNRYTARLIANTLAKILDLIGDLFKGLAKATRR